MNKSNLFGSALNATRVVQLPLDQITQDPNQPRKHFDENALKELASSIEAQGLIQPITVRKNEDGEGYIITAGERRFRAVKSLGNETIDAIIRTSENADVVSIIENTQRENLLPVEEAEAVARLIEVHNMSQGDAGKALGKGRLVVNQLLKINDLPADIKTASVEAKTPKTVLVELSQIKKKSDQLELWNKSKGRGLSVKEIREFKSRVGGKKKVSPSANVTFTDAVKAGERFEKVVTALDTNSIDDDQKKEFQGLLDRIQSIIK